MLKQRATKESFHNELAFVLKNVCCFAHFAKSFVYSSCIYNYSTVWSVFKGFSAVLIFVFRHVQKLLFLIVWQNLFVNDLSILLFCDSLQINLKSFVAVTSFVIYLFYDDATVLRIQTLIYKLNHNGIGRKAKANTNQFESFTR